MAKRVVADSEVARFRHCHWQECRAVFSICVHCDRGQRYCSDACRVAAQRQQRAKANARYQSSSSGKQVHRDCQRRYRSRKREEPVTDAASNLVTRTTPDPPPVARLRPVNPRCVVCGTPKYWTDTSARIPGEWQRRKRKNRLMPWWFY